MLVAANRNFLLSYWSALVHAPPSSSDRAQPPPQRPRPTHTERGDPGLGHWDWPELTGRLLSDHGLVNVIWTHPLVAPSPPARPRSVPQSVSSSFFPPLSRADTFLSSGQARSLLARYREELEEGRDPQGLSRKGDEGRGSGKRRGWTFGGQG